MLTITMQSTTGKYGEIRVEPLKQNLVIVSLPCFCPIGSKSKASIEWNVQNVNYW